MLRVVDVIHSRLGAVTRQHAHEMTHGARPEDVMGEAQSLAAELRELAGGDDLPERMRPSIVEIADRADTLAAVGNPPRGHQFTASAQILLQGTHLARNAFASRPDGIDVPPAYRGVHEALVEELSRVRTDLDALEPDATRLLMAQGYYLADFYLKLTMPTIVTGASTPAWYTGGMAPKWEVAQAAVTAANANPAHATARLSTMAQRALLLGRSRDDEDARRYSSSLTTVVVGMGVVLLTALGTAVWALCVLFRAVFSSVS